MRVRKYEGGEVQQIRFMHKGKDIVFQHMVKSQARYYTEDIPELIKNRIEIEFNDICEMDAMIDMLIRAEEHLLGEMGKWKVKSINEEEYKRRMERLRRTLDERPIFCLCLDVDQHGGSSQRRNLGNTQRMVPVGNVYTGDGKSEFWSKGE